jgi:hypothetical protein
LLHLSWFGNGDCFDVALVANRLATRGVAAWRLARGEGAEAGDYLLDLPPGALDATGLDAASWTGRAPEPAQRLAPARLALLAGSSCGYPYYAYYALCLDRLGYDFSLVDAREIAEGALGPATHLVLPGGFEIWGLDRAEGVSGADREVRRFLASGGAAIGSCGGAYYLSSGRPGWTGTAAAKPRWSHEYLSTGAGLVTVALGDGPLSVGCPPTLEMPYYHGPVWDAVGPGAETDARFADLLLPGQLFIPNPLDPALFERDMKGRPAILRCDGVRGRALLFSPHPEMGDLVRKYIALDAYARRYLPIRGPAVLRDTLRHYAPLESPSFRLVLNAVDTLLPLPSLSAEASLPSLPQGERGGELRRAIVAALDGVTAEDDKLVAMVADDLGERISRLAGTEAVASQLASEAASFLDGERGAVEQLCAIELGLALLEAAQRRAAIEAALP